MDLHNNNIYSIANLATTNTQARLSFYFQHSSGTFKYHMTLWEGVCSNCQSRLPSYGEGV